MARTSGLLATGLRLMERKGKPLTKLPERGNLYRMADGKTVRVRTCVDHQIPMSRAKHSNRLQMQDGNPDYLLAVMLEDKDTKNVMAFLVLMPVAVEAAETSLKEWLGTKPNRRSETTEPDEIWHIPFYDHHRTGGYAKKWAQYRLVETD